GLAVSPDLRVAYVTSAWSHALTAVELTTGKVLWSVDTAREPRGVVASADGKRVYVTHLVGADITVVELGDGAPNVTRVALPADALRTRLHAHASASLGYAALLSPDGARLFVARHALGSGGAWQGNPTIDVFSTALGEPLAPSRGLPAFGTIPSTLLDLPDWGVDGAGALPIGPSAGWAVPRALAYRKKTDHLLVASEATAALVELDARSVAPGLVVNRTYALGGVTSTDPTTIQIPPDCGAPTGVALSAQEDVAWVYCRATDNLVAVRLTPNGARGVRAETEARDGVRMFTVRSPWGPFAVASLVAPPAPGDAEASALALGRRLFYDATEPAVSGGASCAGCHPDGRDDGHVWREMKKFPSDKRPTFVSGPSMVIPEQQRDDGVVYGVARQTPMLAGRVDAHGPYGWHAESPDVIDRIKQGFSLHRWTERPADGLTNRRRAEPLALFLRKGLVPPPRRERELTVEEAVGKAIFDSPEARCSTCHAPKTDFTDRSMVVVPLQTPPLFDEDPNKLFRVPSLKFVGGTAPYYHDGSVATLEELVAKNYDRMGKTTHLDEQAKAALVAYLKTL
ncbi:MAG TPA: hypothetical protein VGM56_27260, partial [Byssovorax sp.]